MSLLIADEQVGGAKKVPYAIPYNAIERFEIEEVDGDFSVIVYTVKGTRKVVKARYSFDRCVELMVNIASSMSNNKGLYLIEG
jgi:hypothetical protein